MKELIDLLKQQRDQYLDVFNETLGYIGPDQYQHERAYGAYAALLYVLEKAKEMGLDEGA